MLRWTIHPSLGVSAQGCSQPVQVPGQLLRSLGVLQGRGALLHGQGSGEGPLAAQRALGSPDLKEPLFRAHWAGNTLVRGF